ncbi:O-methyltransferase, putative [Talaromyces stipitatus ATCC 10500]|uniref:O-methyltransferase, putative n=1 Tax=Talaromyces stipitatus (strain ATCC 10500 / CBS 375.48 / QM 6759 / NRRL 1006) TaxID=441959 RepID=B8MTF2_TALSN|nr:O-methyltransferase, putative [Talaromyces stipitatus ATCC 10500]EED12284.1 O-methyltransferase, putative [Talaromyces stipitatus ATCC 10500]
MHNSTKLPLSHALASMPDKANSLAEAMRWQLTLPAFSHHYLTEASLWGSGEEQLTVVDVGGGVGHASQALLDHNPHVKCVIQDYPDVVSQVQQSLPEQYKSRTTFQAHDFFQEQPAKDAAVYLLRMALIPALKLGAKNVRERTAQGWSALLKGVDERFQLTAIHQPAQSTLAVVEVTWSARIYCCAQPP